MPKVSVIIPVYGVEKYIERCIHSLFEQTISDVEFVFVNDCTPDRSMEILAEMMEDYQPRLKTEKKAVRILEMPTNSGQAAVRRAGIELCSGDYIIHCDSDDWVEPSMLETMYNLTCNGKADVVVCDMQSHDGCKQISYIPGLLNADRMQCIRSMLFQNTAWSLCNKLFKRELYKHIDNYPKDNMGEDMAICMQLFYYCHRIEYVARPFYYYYCNPGSIVHKNTKETVLNKFQQYNQNLSIVIGFYSSKNEFHCLEKEFTWLKYSVKSILDYPDKQCRALWRRVYPFSELRILFLCSVTRERKIKVLKSIIKNYFIRK